MFRCRGVILQSCVVELRQYKLVFRRYRSLYFIVGLDINGDDVLFDSSFEMQNEMAIYEFIHCYVETLDAVIGKICELDVGDERFG